MKIIEITYRYDGTDATVRPRPADAERRGRVWRTAAGRSARCSTA